MKKLTKQEFIAKAKLLHGDKYDYLNVVYVDSKTNIEVICRDHGLFQQTPGAALQGRGCPKCKAIKRSNDNAEKFNTEHFIAKAKVVHGDLYDYSKSTYVKALVKVTIICKQHGEFEQAPSKHWDGQGCPICKWDKLRKAFSSDSEAFIAKAISVHGNTYAYGKVNYLNSKTKVDIFCRVHNEYFQKNPIHHLQGQGCPKCSQESATLESIKPWAQYLKDVTEVHLGKNYSYELVDNYVGTPTKLKVNCKTHGPFFVNAGLHLHSASGCSRCNASIKEHEVCSFIQSLGVEVILNNRTIIKPYELDMVIPELRIAVEYNGLYYHSEACKKDKNYHLMKTEMCEKAGYRLIHVFEDEWIHKQNIVKSRLTSILRKETSRLYARKLQVRKLTSAETFEFLSNTHIQGPGHYLGNSYGLIDGEDITACMTFCPRRFDEENGTELLRFSTKGSVVGGFSKLIKAFSKDNPDEKLLVSYSDRRWSSGGVYSNNGFTHVGRSSPGYDYVTRDIKRMNRQKFMKHKLASILESFDPNLTEEVNCANNGFFRIWNCGMDKWILNL